MNKTHVGRLVAWLLVLVASVAVATVSCSLVTSVDRDLIPPAGGSGGVGGTGGAGAIGGTGGVYAQADFANPGADLQVEETPLPSAGAEPVTMAIEFIWREAVSKPAPFDLSVGLVGVEAPLAQVFSIDDGPFVRSGTLVEAIRPDEAYRLEITRTSVTAFAQFVRASDDVVVLSGPVVEVAPTQDRVAITSATDGNHLSLGAVRVWQGLGAVRR